MKQNGRIVKTIFSLGICIALLMFCLYCSNKGTIMALLNIDNYIEGSGEIVEESTYKRIGAEVTIQYHYNGGIFTFTDWWVGLEKVGDSVPLLINNSGNAVRRNIKFKTAYEKAFLLTIVILCMVLVYDIILLYKERQINTELRTRKINASVIKIREYIDLNTGQHKYQYLAEMKDETGKKHKFWSCVVMMPDNIHVGDGVKVVIEPGNYKNYYVKL